MKVVLFCGGLGLRIREFSGDVPKPMVHIGHRPILWHIMKYYAHFGYKDFVLCLGYKGKTIKDYFLNYNECISNNFTLFKGGKKMELASRDIDDWTISFVDTGMTSTVGERLLAVKDYLGDDEMFLANYSDNLTDFPMPDLVEKFEQTDNIGAFLSVKPSHSFHIVESDGMTGTVSDIKEVWKSGIMLNGGYFVFRKEVFDYLDYGEDLVTHTFDRLIEMKKLMTYKYKGFWACMDTFKERKTLEEMYACGNAAWEVWQARSQPKGIKIASLRAKRNEELVNA